MSRINLLLFLSCVLCSPFASARADEATSQPATQPSGEVIDVSEFEKLKEMIGQEATVRGIVKEVFVPRSGSVKIFNFEGIDRRAFNVVVPKANLDAVNAGFEGDVEAAVNGKTITVSGKIADYRGNPQIQLEQPEQLQIEPSLEAATEKPAEEQTE